MPRSRKTRTSSKSNAAMLFNCDVWLVDTIYRPENFDPQAYLADSFGVAVDESYKPEQIRVRVSGIQRQYIRTLPLHASQQETEITDESSVFEFYLRPTLDFQQELLTHAANTDGKIEVLKPQWLCEQMRQIGSNLLENHKTVGSGK